MLGQHKGRKNVRHGCTAMAIGRDESCGHCFSLCFNLSFKIEIWVTRWSEIKCSVCNIRKGLERSRNVRGYIITFCCHDKILEVNNLREGNFFWTYFQKGLVIMVLWEGITEISQWQKQGEETILELQMGVINNPSELCSLGLLSQRTHNPLE